MDALKEIQHTTGSLNIVSVFKCHSVQLIEWFTKNQDFGMRTCYGHKPC